MSKKSAIVSGYGFAMQLGATMNEIRRAQGVTEEEFHILGTPEGRPHLERMIAGLKRKSRSAYPVPYENILLKPVSSAIVSARTKPINLVEFYQTGTHLYVYGTFAKRLDLNARQTVDSAPERPYVASRLKANAYDTDIRKELPETHLAFLEDIAGLIEAQLDGKSGFLINNGYANIFYVEGKNSEVFAVSVSWGSVRRRWRVGGWGLDEDGEWSAGHRVLCPGNAAL